jgi:alpha-1,2-mannosyltransferase
MICRMPLRASLTRVSSALTVRRLRIHGLLLGTCLWSVYAFNIATPGLLDRNGLVKGTDFVHFYVLGSLALEHRGSALYNTLLQSEIAQSVVPSSEPLYFVALYGPQVSMLFAPLARLPYGWALLLWSIINASIYGLCCFALWRACPNLLGHGETVAILAFAYPAFFHLIAWGQTSAPALLFFTLAYLALRSDREFLAGVAIGLLIYKPPLGFVAVVMFLLSKQWKALGGTVVAGIAELSAGWMYYGTPVMRDYWNAIQGVGHVLPYLEPRPYAVHCLRAFWSMLVPNSWLAAGLYVVSGVVVLVISLLVWRSRAPLSLRYSVLLIASVLVAPHLTIYDLVVLAPAFLFAADWAVSRTAASSPVPILLYLCYALPLIGPLARYTRVQLSVVAFVALLYSLWKFTDGQHKPQTATA